MSNRYIVPTGVLIIGVLIIAAGYLILTPHAPQNPTDVENESYIEPSEKDASSFMPEIKVKADELKLNSELLFKAGNKYRYEYKITMPLNMSGMGNDNTSDETDKLKNINMKMSGSADIDVDRIEQYNKSPCFVLKYLTIMKYENLDELMAASNEKIKSEKEMQMMNVFKEGINFTGEMWINKEGRTMKMVQKMFGMEITMEGERAEQSGSTNIGTLLVQRWYLALNENFAWTKETTVNMTGMSTKSIEKYKVVDVEEISTKDGKRKCYKVEAESSNDIEASGNFKGMTGKKMVEKSVMWIDYNKRILVKAESWMGNLKISDIDLVYEK